MIGFSNTTLSNSLTICPGLNSPKSPPLAFDGQEEYDCASLANRSSNVDFGPSNNRSFNEIAKDSSATKICEALALGPGTMKLPNDLNNETPIAATHTVKSNKRKIVDEHF